MSVPPDMQSIIKPAPVNICPQCEKVCYSKAEYKYHKATHKKKPGGFKCTYEQCSAVYSLEDTLKNHIRMTHTGERPFPCAFAAQLSCPMRFHAGYQTHGHMQECHDDYLYHCRECLQTPKAKKGRDVAHRGWASVQTFRRHMAKNHLGQDIDQLLVKPLLSLPSPENPSERPRMNDSMEGSTAGPSLSYSRPHSNARVSYEAEDADELESDDAMEIIGAPPVRVLKSSKTFKRPRELSATSLYSHEQQATRSAPFIQEESSVKRSRASTMPFSQLPWNERLSGLPASRLQGYTYVHQSGAPPPPISTPDITPAFPTTLYPLPEPNFLTPYRTSGSMDRSNSESGLLSAPPYEGRTFASRARSNTAPDSPSHLPTDVSSNSPLSLRMLPLPPTALHERIIPPPPHGTLWRSANRDSVREGTPGGWSTATSSSMTSAVSGSSDTGEDGRARSSSASSWRELPAGFTENFTRWTAAHAHETTRPRTSPQVAGAGAGAHITPITQFPSSTRMSSDPGAFPGIETFDRPRSASPEEQRPSEYFSHRRTASNT